VSAARTALITGAGGGIGAAIARELSGRGFKVALTYRSRRREAEALADELGGRAYALDYLESDAVTQLVRRLRADFESISVLVHNAGLLRDGLLALMNDADWDAVQTVNLRGPFLLTRAVLRDMLAARWGRVVAIASISGVTGQVGQANYAAAKAGLVAMTKSLAKEVASYGVTANALAPGFIDTEILAGMPEKKLAEYLQTVPLRRLGKASEVAALVGYLCSEEAAYMTGQTLRLDGGLVSA
jgi:3-oxoacyl-[acyl-carrier protein] reductase